jgi:uncharacterized protein
MAKIILLALGLLFVYWLLKGYRRRVDRDAARPAPPVEAETMVKCAQCGVHLPRSESITTGGSFYCSAEHQRAHQAGRGA